MPAYASDEQRSPGGMHRWSRWQLYSDPSPQAGSRAPAISRESQRRALSTVQHPSASMMASCSAGRTSLMLSFARVGWTRFVSNTT